VTAGPSKIVVFRLGDEEYGVSIDSVEGIIRREEVTPVPYAPQAMLGVINLRGRIVPVIDLAERFGLQPTAPGPAARIVIALVDDERVGLAVEAATEVLQVPTGAVDPPPEALSSPAMRDAVLGVARIETRLIVLLRVEQVVPSVEELAAAGEEVES